MQVDYSDSDDCMCVCVCVSFKAPFPPKNIIIIKVTK